MKEILIFTNSIGGLYNFRIEVLQEISFCGYKVNIIVPPSFSSRYKDEISSKYNLVEVDFDRKGLNPLKELRLIYEVYKIIEEMKPHLILTYTIKPNLYGNFVARILGIPVISNLTGLGSMLHTSKFKKIFLSLYKIALRKTRTIFFQNQANYDYFIEKNIVNSQKSKILPGSGVNLDKFLYSKLTMNTDSNYLTFVYAGRLIKDKGILELIDAWEYLSQRYPNIKLLIAGKGDEERIMNKKSANIIFLGSVKEIRSIFVKSDCLIHPSYHEGMSNVMLEAAATGRPLLASNIPGCKEIIDDGVNGFLFEPRSSDAIVEAVEKFMALSFEERQEMGRKSREKVEREFDRQIVVDAYMKEIERILEDN